MLQNFTRRAIELTYLSQKLLVGKIVGKPIRRDVRRTTARHQKMLWLNAEFLAQQMSKLVSDQRAHAVTKQSDWSIDDRRQIFNRNFDQVVHVCVSRLGQTATSAWQLDRAYFNVRGKTLLPFAINLRRTSRVRKAKQTQRGVRV